jgi:lysophospholipase
MIITVTQCTHGSVSSLYATGKSLLDIGIVPGSDITPEAALTKLSWVLSKTGLSLEQKRKMMETNIVGEMTVIDFKGGESGTRQLNKTISTDSLATEATEELDLIQAVAKQLHIKTSHEIDGLRDVLFPSILCAMVHSGISQCVIL